MPLTRGSTSLPSSFAGISVISLTIFLIRSSRRILKRSFLAGLFISLHSCDRAGDLSLSAARRCAYPSSLILSTVPAGGGGAIRIRVSSIAGGGVWQRTYRRQEPFHLSRILETSTCQRASFGPRIRQKDQKLKGENLPAKVDFSDKLLFGVLSERFSGAYVHHQLRKTTRNPRSECANHFASL